MGDGLKALKYAEDNLQVNKVHEDAVAHRVQLEMILTELGAARDLKRTMEIALHDREMEVASNEYGKHPEMAQTRMDKHIKQALAKDAGHREIRSNLAVISGTVDQLEYDRTVIETDIKIAVSRMTELGGYLNYLAAIKNAAESVKPTTPGEIK